MTTKTNGVIRPHSLCDGGSSRNNDLRALGAALGLSAAMLMPAQLLAQSQVEDADQAPLATVTVEDTAIDPNPNAQLGVPYKARTSGDERHSRPLAETPQTITVLTRSQIEDSGYTDLARILNAQPGITVGTGENGNAFGDRYIIRGQEARSDVFVDGLRDPGMTTRESFAIEQLEISKGPNSSFAGRGTSGGAVNAITKQATTSFNFGRAGVALGSDQHVRATLDFNYSPGERFAVRANALYAYEEVPGRAPADRKRKGLAVSALYTPTDDLSITLDYYGLRAKDNPDLGSYLINVNGKRLPAENVPVYAQKQDFQKSNVNTVTGRIRYSFSPDVRLTNITRYGDSNNGYVNTGARGGTTGANNPGGVYATTILDGGHQGWQRVSYFATQTNLYVDSEMLGGKNQLIVGGEYTDHKVRRGAYILGRTGAYNCITNAGTTLNGYCATNPDGSAVNGLNTLVGRTVTRNPTVANDWHVETVSAYVLDTVDLTPALTLFAGVRMDHFKFGLDTFNGTTGVQTGNYGYSDTLWNGHAGLTWKIGGGGLLYVTVATAADINGGESDTGTSSGYGGLVIYDGDAAGAKPERSVNLEAGTKWNILDEKLLLTAAIFQSTKDDVMEGANYDSVGTFNTGKNRVRGVEFSIAGNVTDAWTVQGGLTLMKSEVLESATAANVGKMVANFARRSAQFQTRYQFTEAFAMGAAVKYESRRYGGQPDTAAGFAADGAGGFTYSQPIPSYTVGDFFAEYQFNRNLALRLNVNNVTDKNYYLAVYRSGSFLYKGDGRTIRGTLTYEF